MIKMNVGIFLAPCLLQAVLCVALPPNAAEGAGTTQMRFAGHGPADSLPAAAVGAHEAAAKIDARYNGMKSLSAEFTEIYSNGAVQRSESGTLKIKKPGKMRWDYTSPRAKLFLTDGSTAWFYAV